MVAVVGERRVGTVRPPLAYLVLRLSVAALVVVTCLSALTALWLSGRLVGAITASLDLWAAVRAWAWP